MMQNGRKEIIVYLDYHSKVANGEGELILDFRRASDFDYFAEAFSEINEGSTSVGTYLRITGYRTRKRLMRGCYYSLNVEPMRRSICSITRSPHSNKRRSASLLAEPTSMVIQMQGCSII